MPSSLEKKLTLFLQAMVDKEYPGEGIVVEGILQNASLVGSGEWTIIRREIHEFSWRANLADRFWESINTLGGREL